MTEDKPPTVRDIEWHVSTNYCGGYVAAEDQTLFMAHQYAEQVCQEHAEVRLAREEIKRLKKLLADHDIEADDVL